MSYTVTIYMTASEHSFHKLLFVRFLGFLWHFLKRNPDFFCLQFLFLGWEKGFSSVSNSRES